MSVFELSKPILTEQMKAEIKYVIYSLRYDYKQNKDKIGRIKREVKFETYRPCKTSINEKGTVTYHVSEPDLTKPEYYECVLTVYVPLTGMSFQATDVHKYRWNSKWNNWQHEESEIL